MSRLRFKQDTEVRVRWWWKRRQLRSMAWVHSWTKDLICRQCLWDVPPARPTVARDFSFQFIPPLSVSLPFPRSFPPASLSLYSPSSYSSYSVDSHSSVSNAMSRRMLSIWKCGGRRSLSIWLLSIKQVKRAKSWIGFRSWWIWIKQGTPDAHPPPYLRDTGAPLLLLIV